MPRVIVCATMLNPFSGCLCDAQRQFETFALQQWKEWVWRRYAMFCFRLHQCLGQPEKHIALGAFRLPKSVHHQHACAFTFLNTRALFVIQYRPFLRQPESVFMKSPFSLLLASLSQRLAIAAAVLLVVWGVYFWAVAA